jgi:hypothetical protein
MAFISTHTETLYFLRGLEMDENDLRDLRDEINALLNEAPKLSEILGVGDPVRITAIDGSLPDTVVGQTGVLVDIDPDRNEDLRYFVRLNHNPFGGLREFVWVTAIEPA